MLLEILKKYFWVAKLAFVALLASELAMLTNTRIDAKLSTTEAVKIEDVKIPKTGGYVSISEYNGILKKNIFNSDYVYIDDALSGAGHKAPEDYLLLGTIAWDQPYSMAIIQSRTSGKTDVYRINQKLEADTEVFSIERRRVILIRAGTQLVLELPDIELPAGRLKVASAADVKPGDDQIKKTGEGEFVVDQNVIDEGFKNPMMWMKGARIVPHFEKGGISGFQVSKIQASSLYGKIGLQDGDVIRRINNVEIKGPEDALKLMTDLKNSKNVRMDITRSGKRMSFNYNVR